MMTFPLHLALLKYVSEILIGWIHPLLHHLSYNHCLGHVIRNPANVITFGQCNGSNVITFECYYICPSLGFVGRNFANVITFSQIWTNVITFHLSGFTARCFLLWHRIVIRTIPLNCVCWKHLVESRFYGEICTPILAPSAPGMLWGTLRSTEYPPWECDGEENFPADCGRNRWKDHNCFHNEDVGVICDNKSGSVNLTTIPISLSSNLPY